MALAYSSLLLGAADNMEEDRIRLAYVWIGLGHVTYGTLILCWIGSPSCSNNKDNLLSTWTGSCMRWKLRRDRPGHNWPNNGRYE